jgi:hypothetical protein
MNSLLHVIFGTDLANDFGYPARRIAGIPQQLLPVLGWKLPPQPGDYIIIDRTDPQVSKGLKDGRTDRIADGKLLGGHVFHHKHLFADSNLA